MPRKTQITKTICPCGSKMAPGDCCQPFIFSNAFPDTAEQLMRSRYTAFTQENAAYLLQSWHSETRPKSIEFDDDTKWLGLKIISTVKGSQTDDEGWVRFVARYKISGKAYRIEEHSYFLRHSDKWLYHSANKHPVPDD
jgi:SEC-C motif domain protein